ncbi:hypothetical protein [Actinoplanes sp. NPDC023714]|uniref:hypothetical protein n=1 Tax=Actinoplanes sp. NPDC023714 TaxID=3154322 RepID=UPI0033D0D9C5
MTLSKLSLVVVPALLAIAVASGANPPAPSDEPGAASGVLLVIEEPAPIVAGYGCPLARIRGDIAS